MARGDRGDFHFFPDGARTLEHSAILPLLLAAAVVFWLIGFDIIYALQDYEFDRRARIAFAGGAVGCEQCAGGGVHLARAHVAALVVFGLLARISSGLLCGLVFILGCLVLEHWLARRRSLNWINHAFFRLNAVISVVFLVVTLTEIVFPFMRF